MALGRPRFGWGIGLDLNTEDLRAAHRQSFQQADAGEIRDLVAFARS